MPDFQNYSVTRRSAVNVNVPRYEIQVRVTDSNTGATIADFTGANALMWPGVLSTLTAEQRDVLIDQIASMIINMKAGIQ